jgi:dihydroorotase
MKVLIKNATVQAPSSRHHGNQIDILIDKGVIGEIGIALSADHADEIIAVENLLVSPGWMDCFANFCDPGSEYKETLETGCDAAATGGYTDVMVIPQTKPVVDSKSQVQYLIEKSRAFPVTVLPIGSVTRDTGGKELSEMYDMFFAGAIAFSDGFNTIQSAGIMQKALEYLLAIEATLIQVPDDKSIGTYGLMNEGIASTRLGLQGKPSLAEELILSRDIELARYTGASIHCSGVSTAKSLSIVAAAKNDGVKITCSCTPYHLFFCDEDLGSYNTYLKVNPPLRAVADREALRIGVKDGTVDFIASHHQPQAWDDKICEFEYAKNGMEGLESVFGAARVCGISSERFVTMQSETIRRIFKQEIPMIEKGSAAKITLFNANESYTFLEENISSKSKNNAFIGQTLTGKAIGIINGEKVFLSQVQFSEEKT